jgi:hypothetical protein
LNHILLKPPDVRDLEPSVPEALSALVARCLLKEPAERPPAEEVACALAVIAGDGPPLHELERAGALRDLEAIAAEAQPTVTTSKRGVA